MSSRISSMLKALVLALTLGFLSGPALAEPGIDAHPVVNINQAGEEELAEALDGVGSVTAKAIVEYRRENGAFDSPEALGQVAGVGPATIENNRERIRTD